MDASTLGAIAAIIAALTGLLNAVQNIISYRQVERTSGRNADISRDNKAAIAAVGVKVEGVAEQTNGHLGTLIAAVAPTNPGLATAAAVQIEQNAALVADRLRKTAGCDKSGDSC